MGGAAPIGKRLLPNIVDYVASQSPDRVYGYYTSPDWETNGYRALTYGQVAQAINKLAYWLDERLGGTEDFETFAYAGSNDFRYMFMVIAAIKTGRRYRLLSTAWTESPKHYPYTKTYEEAKDESTFIVHTSGTTGHPKPIVKTNFMISATDLIQTLSKDRARISIESVIGSRYLTPLPAHWLMGVGGMMQLPIQLGVVPFLLPMDAPTPINVDLIKRIHRVADLDGGFYPPSLLKDMCADQEALSLLRKSRYVAYGGAPLEKWVGDMLCDSTLIVPFLGSTELGFVPLYESPGKEWRYYRFHPASGYRMELFKDHLYELVVDRKPGFEALQPVFKLFPELDSFHTKDLYSRHGENAWLFQGRADDFVKLGGLAKVFASEMESAIGRHPGVKCALVGGEGKPVPFLLIEAKEGNEGLMDDIEGILNDINKDEAQDIRIPKDMVLLADPGRPFRLTAKRTLDRRAILTEYRADIDALYATATAGV